jgi:glycosyltransferase involved in cell wall biosynthesis
MTVHQMTILKSYGSQIRWVKQKNQGVGAARNHGVRESTGELVAFLDADDCWLPLKIERQVHRFANDDQLGLVHCGVEEIDETGAHLRLQVDGLEGWVATQLLLFNRPVILGGGSGLMVSRASFDAINGFDIRLSTAADWDLFYRMAIRQRVGFVSEPLLKYRLHTSNMHSNLSAMEHDMMIGYAKAFDSGTYELARMRSQCYGNLHMVLAGSFFRAGRRGDFLRHAFKSLWLTPGNSSRLFGFPFRELRRRQRRLLNS